MNIGAVLGPADIFNWDWTAIGTLALAAVTTVSLRLGYLALEDTRAELDASQRPVMVPVASNIEVDNPTPRSRQPSPYRQVTGIAARPTALSEGMLMVPIRNIGAGPALSITVIVIGCNDAGEYSEVWGNRMYDGYVYAAPVGDTIPVLVKIDRLSGHTPNFALMIAYRDLAGRNFCTEAKYRQAGSDGRYGMYFDPKIQSLSGDEDPGEAMLASQREQDRKVQARGTTAESPSEDEEIDR